VSPPGFDRRAAVWIRPTPKLARIAGGRFHLNNAAFVDTSLILCVLSMQAHLEKAQPIHLFPC
jgi:hypothetical protein